LDLGLALRAEHVTEEAENVVDDSLAGERWDGLRRRGEGLKEAGDVISGGLRVGKEVAERVGLGGGLGGGVGVGIVLEGFGDIRAGGFATGRAWTG
jgi:hypothetical protein